jgi:putative signal transducing protein
LQIDLDDFRRRYAELSDEALLELDRDDLVDLARDCYDAELARRGLRRTLSSPPATAEVQDHGELVEAARFSFSSEADLARALLESAAIPCYLENEFAGKTLGTTDGLRLFVPASLLESAREILEAPVSEEELIAQAEAEPAPSEGEE